MVATPEPLLKQLDLIIANAEEQARRLVSGEQNSEPNTAPDSTTSRSYTRMFQDFTAKQGRRITGTTAKTQRIYRATQTLAQHKDRIIAEYEALSKPTDFTVFVESYRFRSGKDVYSLGQALGKAPQSKRPTAKPRARGNAHQQRPPATLVGQYLFGDVELTLMKPSQTTPSGTQPHKPPAQPSGGKTT